MKPKQRQQFINQQHGYDHNQGQVQQNYIQEMQGQRKVPSKQGHKQKMNGLNQSMDAGVGGYHPSMGGFSGDQTQSKMYVQRPVGQQQNYITSSPFDPNVQSQKGQHFRSGSQIVGANVKKQQTQFKNSNFNNDMQNQMNYQQMANQYELTKAQLSQLKQLQGSHVMQQQVQNGSDRAQQQKAKRKHNLSQHIHQQQQQFDHRNGESSPDFKMQALSNSHHMTSDFNQNLSKRSADNSSAPGDKLKQKHSKHQSIQNTRPEFPVQFDSGRQSSISKNNNQQVMAQNSSKERFSSTNKASKKGKVSATQNQIILPAGTMMQGVPHLKQQLNSKHVSVTNQMHSQMQPLKMSQSLQNQQNLNHNSHQRMQSLPDSSQVGANMARGFNSASNAAIQQAQIIQIYQQQNAANAGSTQSQHSVKQKNFSSNQTSNSRKIIPQISQVISQHKRSSQHQVSRDRDSKQLSGETYPVNNYQTYSQSYGSANQIQGMINSKQKSSESSRINRINSKDSRRALIPVDHQKPVQDPMGSYQHSVGTSQALTIPQKKMKANLGSSKYISNQEHNHSMNNLAKQGFIQSAAPLSFFDDIHGTSVQVELNRPQSKGKNHASQQLINQFSQQPLTQSMNQTIQPQFDIENKNARNDSMVLQNLKSGPVGQQLHMRQASVHIGNDSAQNSKKMSVQHRKNKTMLNNQIKINPTTNQNYSGTSSQLRKSQDSTSKQTKPFGYFDNYADHTQQNFYMQQPGQASKIPINPQQMTGSSQSLGGGPQLKQALNNTSHRKNKTSVIGNQKLVGLNSSSAFQPIGNMPPSLMAAESQPQAALKKIIGGTISHSHKSLRSTSSSQRKRVSSVDLNSGKNKYDSQGRKNTSMNQNPSQYSNKALQQERTSNQDISQYENVGKHKAHNSMTAQIIPSKQLKPQGNIVISSQTKAGTHEEMISQAMANRKHTTSLLKGEHQNKQMIYVDQENNHYHNKQNVVDRFGGQNGTKNNPRFIPPQRFETATPEQESAGSVSSIRANNMSFQDGGTGGGKMKHQTRQSNLIIDSATQPPPNQTSSFNSEQKSVNKGKYEGLINKQAVGDYSASNGPRQAQLKANFSNSKNRRSESIDIDSEAINVPNPNKESIKQEYENKAVLARNKAQKAQRSQKHKQEDMQRNFDDFNALTLFGIDSINITREALQLGKVPPEMVAEKIRAKNFKMNSTDVGLSPRSKEMVGISGVIRKSFQLKGIAPKTTPDFYRAGKMLGRGAFGKVSLGMHKLSRKLVALKSINKEYMSDVKQKSKIMHEVGILLRMRHPYVVKLYETFETKRHMLLSMELCAGGDLLNYVRKRKKLDEDSAKIIFKQIIEGLGYIHRKRILHRDIKLDNILLDGNGNVKIADFGVSKMVKQGEVMHEQSGTPAYIAPEILKEEGYQGFKADIWSSGVVLYAMLCGTVPFKASNMKELHKMIIKGKYHLKEEVTDHAKHLLRALLETDPKKRLSVQKILEHPWMRQPENPPEIFNQEEKEIVGREFVYNNPNIPNRSEVINTEVEPWDCFTELNLDSINQTLRNESEKSIILAPFNSSLSDFNEDDYKDMKADLIIHRLFDDTTALCDKKDMVRFAARCRDQDRQYEINNNGDLDNGVYHKFVYSSRDGNPEPSSSFDGRGGSVNDLRPQSSRNATKPSDELRQEIAKRVREGKMLESEATDDYGMEDSRETTQGDYDPLGGFDEGRIRTLCNFGYPEEYVRFCLAENESCYCMATYLLLAEDQRYTN